MRLTRASDGVDAATLSSGFVVNLMPVSQSLPKIPSVRGGLEIQVLFAGIPMVTTFGSVRTRCVLPNDTREGRRRHFSLREVGVY